MFQAAATVASVRHCSSGPTKATTPSSLCRVITLMVSRTSMLQSVYVYSRRWPANSLGSELMRSTAKVKAPLRYLLRLRFSVCLAVGGMEACLGRRGLGGVVWEAWFGRRGLGGVVME